MHPKTGYYPFSDGQYTPIQVTTRFQRAVLRETGYYTFSDVQCTLKQVTTRFQMGSLP